MRTLRFVVRAACLLPLLLAGPAGTLPSAHADENVRQVQEELRKRNLYYGDIDGRITPQVAAALRQYQKGKGFDPTGQPDEVTLRSLNLLPALPLTPTPREEMPAEAAVASAPPAHPAAPPWPDTTVLRSDAARRNAPPPDTDNDGEVPPAADQTPAPTVVSPAPVTPGPPPSTPAAPGPWRPPPGEVRAFLARYLRAGQTNDPPAELAFYGDHVDYFDEGVVDRRFIEADVTRYDRRWPQRHFVLLDPVTLAAPPDRDPDKFVAHFRYAFTNKNTRYTVDGKVDVAFTIQDDGAGRLRIVGMKERRVRGE